jgi:hypothetical protein
MFHLSWINESKLSSEAPWRCQLEKKQLHTKHSQENEKVLASGQALTSGNDKPAACDKCVRFGTLFYALTSGKLFC